ncbi:hypothetical protein C8Q76DRAFT_634747 [Earliella scabrosa]|nr:hypothetical protein C8Q76DRAFT_634747 [Earliella scabrosa]
MEDARPTKRHRTEPDDPPSTLPPETLKHDEEFWFDDGNIVLVARDTAFRIYRGLLAAQSPVFADMFFSSTPIMTELYEGCPVVHLTDDPDDLRDFLRVLLPKTHRRYYECDPEHDFEELSAVIRLAHKYNVEDVEKQAIQSLRRRYTDDFDALTTTEYAACRPLKLRLAHLPNAIGAINLARLTDTPSILPTAFYFCCQLLGRVIDGYTRRDGTVEKLSDDDLKRCIDGRDKLARAAGAYILRVIRTTPKTGCPNPSSCQAILLDIHSEATHDPDVCSAALFDTIWNEWLMAYGGLCKLCLDSMLDRELFERRGMWGRLPAMFDLKLEGWK